MSEEISFGQWLKRRRKMRDLTQVALARAVPCAVQTIRALESDALRPSRELAARLAHALGIAPHDHDSFVAFARGGAAPADWDALSPAPHDHKHDAVPSAVPPRDVQADGSPPSAASLPRPSGTVTFLFTDIVGSTRLWEQYPAEMPDAFRRHEAIVRGSVAAHGGYVYKMIGDAFQAAFTTAPSALAAALAAQRLLIAEDWGAIGSLQVRMALDSGVVEERGDDYVGPLLNRTARLLAAAHGGQVLLSAATRELVRVQLPPELALRDLGVYHLKGLRHPEPIFQVVAPDLPSDFPALAARAAGYGNLPPEPTPFIGRVKEVEAVRLCLCDPGVRLLTLTGPGGTGKTRLALQVAAALREEYPDGVWFVDLTPIHDVNLVATAIIQTLSEGGVRSEASTEWLSRYLGDKQLLLILDNFEQLLAANVLLSDILRKAPQVTLLVTSRSRLHLAAEHELAIPPMALPDLHQLPSLDRLLQVDAVHLFVSRVRAVLADYQLTAADTHAVAAICVALDGLPLAIELAAARSKLLSPSALLARLDQRLRFLTGGSHDLARRHQTLRSTIDWSYMLLSPAEQTLFRRLGIFVGGWTIEAAEAVCGAISDGSPEIAGDMLEGLESLLDHSLVRPAPRGTGTAHESPRLLMLETLREYALERLASSGEAETIRWQHCSYYLGLAETATPKLVSPEWRTWQRRLEAELGNLQAALEWTLSTGQVELALRMGTALIGTWWAPATVLRNWYQHAQEWARTSADTLPLGAKAQLFRHIGRYALWHAEYARALTYTEQALAFFQALDDAPGIAKTIEYLADVARDTGDFAGAEQLYRESLARFERLEDAAEVALIYHASGELALLQDAYDRAYVQAEESLRRFRALGAKWGEALVTTNVGYIELHRGNIAQALASMRESVVNWRDLGSIWGMSYGLAGIAVVVITHEAQSPHSQPAHQARVWQSVRLLGLADVVWTDSDAPLFRAHGREIERAIAVARGYLNESAFADAWSQGRAGSLELAIEEAVAIELTS